jgi:hypothetical protein
MKLLINVGSVAVVLLVGFALLLFVAEGQAASKKKCLYFKNGYCYSPMTSGEIWKCKGLPGGYDPAHLHYSMRVQFHQRMKEGKCHRIR